MPLSLIFARHGETEWNVAGRLQGQTDIPLNPKGRDQADAVGRALKDLPGVAGRSFVASPLSRATETMRRIRVAMGLDPDAFSTDPRLAELSFGRWEGATFRELREREPGEMRRRERDRWGHRPPGGESYEDVSARVAGFIGELGGPAVVVSHGGVARTVLAMAGEDRAKLPQLRIQQGRAMLFEDGGWRWL